MAKSSKGSAATSVKVPVTYSPQKPEQVLPVTVGSSTSQLDGSPVRLLGAVTLPVDLGESVSVRYHT